MLSRDPLLREAQEWARETFGPPPSPARVAARTAEELAEWLQAATGPENRRREQVLEESADVFICIARLLDSCGIDSGRPDVIQICMDYLEIVAETWSHVAALLTSVLFADPTRHVWANGALTKLEELVYLVSGGEGIDQHVRRKLEINRRRTWEVVNGCGRHVKGNS